MFRELMSGTLKFVAEKKAPKGVLSFVIASCAGQKVKTRLPSCLFVLSEEIYSHYRIPCKGLTILNGTTWRRQTVPDLNFFPILPFQTLSECDLSRFTLPPS
jgi:hypothetical protein